jgi:hypothetical protein
LYSTTATRNYKKTKESIWAVILATIYAIEIKYNVHNKLDPRKYYDNRYRYFYNGNGGSMSKRRKKDNKDDLSML